MARYELAFIGAGQMARALAAGIARSGILPAEKMAVFDPSAEALAQFLGEVPGCHAGSSNAELVDGAGAVFLAVKPQHFEEVAGQIQPSRAKPLFLSILAGVPISRLVRGVGAGRVIRVMPNTPCLVGAGACAFARGPDVSDEDAARANQWLGAVGWVAEVDEKLMDAVTGLSGSGPAYVFAVMEALSDGGVREGLPRPLANRLAAQTVLGAARLVLETGEHPAVLKERVTSPGGTTIEGLAVLERAALRSALVDAVSAAARRSRQLASDTKDKQRE